MNSQDMEISKERANVLILERRLKNAEKYVNYLLMQKYGDKTVKVNLRQYSMIKYYTGFFISGNKLFAGVVYIFTGKKVPFITIEEYGETENCFEEFITTEQMLKETNMTAEYLNGYTTVVIK